jgi:site-specific recombinase XerD
MQTSNIFSGRGRLVRKEEEMRTPLALFKDRADADITLDELRQAYTDYLSGRETPVSPKTIYHYMDTLNSFEKSLVLHGKPPVLGEVTPINLRVWVADMRAGKLPNNGTRPPSKCSDQTIKPRHAALKTFTHRFIYRELRLTERDLLEEVERFECQRLKKDMLDQSELDAIRACFHLPTYEHVRDRAIFEIHMATALRFDTVRSMPMSALDRLSGKVTVTTKGGKIMQGKVDAKAMAHVRAYLRIRPETSCPQLFVTDRGEALTYGGGRMIWRRIQQRSGVKRLGSHLIRHTYAQKMALQGAPVADIQDVLGHESDKMARHYAGDARKIAAADLMAKYSLAS